ncbi:656_t:CDS:1, partial [Funneliformis geosporum]
IPIVKIIKGWIGKYSASFKKKVSEKTLKENMENNQGATATESNASQR